MSLAESTPKTADIPTGTPPSEVDVLVIGGGVSGTALAHGLKSRGVSMLLTEARDKVGGNVISRQENGYTWEEGPNTFQPAAHIMRLLVDVGIKDELVLADSTLPRFVYWDNLLYALPTSPAGLLNFKLLSPKGFIRAGIGAMGLIASNFAQKEETVREFITRHLGDEVFRKMIDPFVSGVYAGDPDALSMSSALKKIFALQNLGGTEGIIEGAIIRIGQKKREEPPLDDDLPKWKGGALGSFKNGLVTLPKAIAENLGPDSVKLEWELEEITRQEDGNYLAVYNTPQGKQSVVTKSIALTTPAKATGKILSTIAPGTVEPLERVPYPCVWSVTLAYPSKSFKAPLRGFGNLIPRSMGIRTLGTIWSSCLFPGRAPEGMELLLSYIGGAKDPTIKNLTQEEVVATVDKDIKKILLKDDEVKPVVVGIRKWDRAIPQYNLGHQEILDTVQEELDSLPGIYVGGNYTSGVAFGDCVLWAKNTAPKIEQFLQSLAK